MNDAFGAAHRAHASTVGRGRAPARPRRARCSSARSRRCAEIVESPERPLVVVLGGAKVTDKVALIDRFLDIADALLIGGAMCFAFFRAQGIETGDSLVEEEGVELAREALEKAEDSDCRLLLPTDLVLGDRFAADAEVRETDDVEVPDGWMGLDVGPRDARGLRRARSRRPARSSGTGRWAPSSWSRSRPARARWPRPSPTRPATTVVGGGDSAAALAQFGLADRVDCSCRPAAARRSSCSRARRCPAWRRSTMPERRPYIAGNWKMYKTIAETDEYVGRLLGQAAGSAELASTSGSACRSPRSATRGRRRPRGPA